MENERVRGSEKARERAKKPESEWTRRYSSIGCHTKLKEARWQQYFNGRLWDVKSISKISISAEKSIFKCFSQYCMAKWLSLKIYSVRSPLKFENTQLMYFCRCCRKEKTHAFSMWKYSRWNYIVFYKCTDNDLNIRFSREKKISTNEKIIHSAKFPANSNLFLSIQLLLIQLKWKRRYRNTFNEYN